MGTWVNVLKSHLHLVIPVSYLCHYTNLCPDLSQKRAHTHTHTHTEIHTDTDTHTHTQTEIHTDIHTDTHTQTYTHTHTHTERYTHRALSIMCCSYYRDALMKYKDCDSLFITALHANTKVWYHCMTHLLIISQCSNSAGCSMNKWVIFYTNFYFILQFVIYKHLISGYHNNFMTDLFKHILNIHEQLQ